MGAKLRQARVMYLYLVSQTLNVLISVISELINVTMSIYLDLHYY